MLLVPLVSRDNGSTVIRVVHPHVSDQDTFGNTDKWYGTSEPMLRVQPGDTLDLFDPITFAKLHTVNAKSAAVLLSPSSAKPWDNPISKAADQLYPSCCAHFPNFEVEHCELGCLSVFERLHMCSVDLRLSHC